MSTHTTYDKNTNTTTKHYSDGQTVVKDSQGNVIQSTEKLSEYGVFGGDTQTKVRDGDGNVVSLTTD